MAKVNETAKRLLRSAVAKVGSSTQAKYTVAGTGIGAAVAAIVGMGSVGVAGGLLTFAVPGVVLLAVPGLIIGNRIGVGIEKHELKKRLRAEAAAEAAKVGPIIDL